MPHQRPSPNARSGRRCGAAIGLPTKMLGRAAGSVTPAFKPSNEPTHAVRPSARLVLAEPTTANCCTCPACRRPALVQQVSPRSHPAPLVLVHRRGSTFGSSNRRWAADGVQAPTPRCMNVLHRLRTIPSLPCSWAILPACTAKGSATHELDGMGRQIGRLTRSRQGHAGGFSRN